ncbi:caspase family protein [Citrobacter koseri]|uniref:caspase family protein n=1 Tax=Citrobacter koseri TaxID=545 RepID=UPI0023AE6D03|nr:caspase family protein [Citrobacter koseri]
MRKALIIGNNNYSIISEKLKNPINDALLIKEVLSYKGFHVTLHTDLNYQQMDSVFTTFCNTLHEGDDVIFFFAGHGIEDRDANYLLSVDYRDIIISDVSLTIDRIHNDLSAKTSSGFKLIIIDACRNNPGLLSASSPEKEKINNNSLIAFSTSSGNVAKDGGGVNSIYTTYLVDSIKCYNLSVSEVFARTREKVIHHTKFSQVPWELSSLLESKSFVFDNIEVPLNLKRIIKNRFNISYSSKFIKDTFFVCGDDQKVCLIQKNSSISGSYNLNSNGGRRHIEGVDFNGEYIVFVSSQGEVFIHGDNKRKIVKCDEHMYTISISKNNLIFLGGQNTKISVLNIDGTIHHGIYLEKEVLPAICNKDEWIHYVCDHITIMSISTSKANPNILAFGGGDSIFCVKDVVNNEYIFINKAKDLFIYTYCIAFSKNGRYAATGHDFGKCLLWNTSDFSVIHTFQLNKEVKKNEFFEFQEERHSNNVHSVEFFPDSKGLAIGTAESKVILFDVTYMKEIKTIDLSIEPHPIYAISFSDDGKNFMVSMNEKNYLFGL